MSRTLPVYPPQLAFLGTISRTHLLRRAWDGQELPPVYYGVGTLDDALGEAARAGVGAVWFRGHVWTRDEVDGDGWSAAVTTVERAKPVRQMGLGL